MDLMTYLLAIKNGSGQGVTYTLSADTLNKKIVLTPSTGDAQSITVPYATDASTINGHDVPELENGKIPAAYLPSYVDDVVEYTSRSDFPSEGESGKIYIDLTTNKIYRWSGSIYAEISESLALGETSTTAYRGDRGKTAYDHSQATGNPHGATLADLNDDSTHRLVTDEEKTAWSNKAEIDGKYNDMTVGTAGTADDLTIETVSDNTPYLYRQSFSGDRCVDQLVGGTVAWNQLVQNGNFASSSGWGVSNGNQSVSNNIDTLVSTSAGMLLEGNVLGTQLNHKYLVSCFIKYDTALPTGNGDIAIGSGGYSMYMYPKSSITLNTWTHIEGLFNRDSTSGTDTLRIYTRSGASNETVEIKNVMLIDLTQAFGSTIADYVYTLESGLAGSGIEWLKSYGFLTKDYYTYNTGSLESVNVASKKVYDESSNLKYTYSYDTSLQLHGIPKLDEDNNLYYDGDVYNANGVLDKLYKLVDLGTLTWRKENLRFISSEVDGWIRPYDLDQVADMLCEKYGVVSVDNLTDKTCASANKHIFVMDSTYNTAEEFAVAMSGVYAVHKYVVKRPGAAIPFETSQVVIQDGYEEYVDYAESQGTRDVAIPVGHNTTYSKYQDWMKTPHVQKVINMADNGGGSNITITPIVTEGQKIADYTVDGVNGSLYAPESTESDNSRIISWNEYEMLTMEEKTSDTTYYINDVPSSASNPTKQKSGSQIIIDDAVNDDFNIFNIEIVPDQYLNGYDRPWGLGGSYNVWDEEWESGNLDIYTGQPVVDSTYFRSKNFNSVKPGENLYVYCDTAYYLDIYIYDINKNFVRRLHFGASKNTVITMPNTGYYIKIAHYMPTYSDHISINRPSTYTKYAPATNICPITSKTNEYMYILNDKIQYFGGLLGGTYSMADLGDCMWYRTQSKFYSRNQPPYIKQCDASEKINAICQNYEAVPLNDISNMCFASNIGNGDFKLVFKNDSYYDINQFTNAVTDQHIIYETISPIQPTVTSQQFNALLQEFNVNSQSIDMDWGSAVGNIYNGRLNVLTGDGVSTYKKTVISVFDGAIGSTENGYVVYKTLSDKDKSDKSISNMFIRSTEPYDKMPVFSYMGNSEDPTVWYFVLPLEIQNLEDANQWLFNLQDDLCVTEALATEQPFHITPPQFQLNDGENGVLLASNDIITCVYSVLENNVQIRRNDVTYSYTPKTDPFIVEVSVTQIETLGGATSDKTYAEIVEAVESGLQVYANITAGEGSDFESASNVALQYTDANGNGAGFIFEHMADGTIWIYSINIKEVDEGETFAVASKIALEQHF